MLSEQNEEGGVNFLGEKENPMDKPGQQEKVEADDSVPAEKTPAEQKEKQKAELKKKAMRLIGALAGLSGEVDQEAKARNLSLYVKEIKETIWCDVCAGYGKVLQDSQHKDRGCKEPSELTKWVVENHLAQRLFASRTRRVDPNMFVYLAPIAEKLQELIDGDREKIKPVIGLVQDIEKESEQLGNPIKLFGESALIRPLDEMEKILWDKIEKYANSGKYSGYTKSYALDGLSKEFWGMGGLEKTLTHTIDAVRRLFTPVEQTDKRLLSYEQSKELDAAISWYEDFVEEERKKNNIDGWNQEKAASDKEHALNEARKIFPGASDKEIEELLRPKAEEKLYDDESKGRGYY